MSFEYLKLKLKNLKSNQIFEALRDGPAYEKDINSRGNITNNKLLWLIRNEEDIFVAYLAKYIEFTLHNFSNMAFNYEHYHCCSHLGLSGTELPYAIA